MWLHLIYFIRFLGNSKSGCSFWGSLKTYSLHCSDCCCCVQCRDKGGKTFEWKAFLPSFRMTLIHAPIIHAVLIFDVCKCFISLFANPYCSKLPQLASFLRRNEIVQSLWVWFQVAEKELMSPQNRNRCSRSVWGWDWYVPLQCNPLVRRSLFHKWFSNVNDYPLFEFNSSDPLRLLLLLLRIATGTRILEKRFFCHIFIRSSSTTQGHRAVLCSQIVIPEMKNQQ